MGAQVGFLLRQLKGEVGSCGSVLVDAAAAVRMEIFKLFSGLVVLQWIR